jgi:kinesin family protein 5
VGESNRVVANQKLNATSSRSHSMLIINIRRLPKQQAGLGLTMDSVTATKGKLLLVDLAGSERISKSGSEGQTLEEAKFINLSLTALGKCINGLAEGTAHIPYAPASQLRETRLLLSLEWRVLVLVLLKWC